jgi:hypothetical protein
MTLEFVRNELTEDPVERQLNMSRNIVVFNIKQSDKTGNLNTGHKFIYQNETYEIMNREAVDSPENYVKFNCVRKNSDK